MTLLVDMGKFCPFTGTVLIMSISRLWYRTIVLQNATTGGDWVKGTEAFSVLFPITEHESMMISHKKLSLKVKHIIIYMCGVSGPNHWRATHPALPEITPGKVNEWI